MTFFYYKPPDVYFFWVGLGRGRGGGGTDANMIDSYVAQDLLNLSLLNKIKAVLYSFEIEIMCNILSIPWLKLSVEKMPKKKKKNLKSYY